MGREVNFEVFIPESEERFQIEEPACKYARISTNTVQKAIESWHVLPLDLVDHTCKYLRLHEVNALGSAHPYFTHLIFGRKRPLPEPLRDPYHPFIVPNAYRTHLELRNTCKTPLTYRQYQLLVDVYRRFDQPLEPSLKIGYIDMREADIDDATLHHILEAFPNPLLLNLQDNPKLKDLAPLANCTALQSLDLSGCTELTQLAPLIYCKNLRHVYLNDCVRITDLTPLVGCTLLQKLQIAGTTVSSLEPLSRLFSLKSFNCKDCIYILPNELNHLRLHSSLEELYLDIQVTDWAVNLLGEFFSLRTLALYDCSSMTNAGLPHLARLTKLRSLLLYRARLITDEGLIHIGDSVRDLTILGCGQVTDYGLIALISLPALKKLTIGPSHQITQIGMQFLQAQKELDWRLASH